MITHPTRAPEPFAPLQITRSYEQQLEASPERILPLLTPLGEKAWAEGWEPIVLHAAPAPGAGTVFLIRAEGQPDTLWQLIDFDERRGLVRYLHVTPGSDVTELEITLRPVAPDRTAATVRYTWTGLTEKGNALAASNTVERYEQFMREWERALNHTLRTGTLLRA